MDYISPTDGLEDWAALIPGENPHTFAVMLHGHGSGGDRLLKRSHLRDSWVPAMRSAGLGLLCPNLRGNAWMSPAAAEDLWRLIAWLRQQYRAQRIILIGGSMGGTSALIYAVLHPQDIHGVVSLCPAVDLPEYWRWAVRNASNRPVLAQIAEAIHKNYGATPDEAPDLFARHCVLSRYKHLTMPLALAHGTADEIIPIQPMRQLVSHLSGRDDVRYEELLGGDHDAPLAKFPEMLHWLLQHARTSQ
jgi:pimeloyl-ACP methyl ester carboxylesterase